MGAFSRMLLMFAAFFLFCVGGVYGWNAIKGESSPLARPTIAKAVPSDPVIEGSPEFIIDMGNALALLRDKSPEHYSKVRKYIRLVKLSDSLQDNTAGGEVTLEGNIHINRRAYELYRKHPKNPFPIRVLVHEAQHMERDEKAGRIVVGEETEREALAAERDMLRALGVSQDVIEKVAGEQLLLKRWWENPATSTPDP